MVLGQRTKGGLAMDSNIGHQAVNPSYAMPSFRDGTSEMVEAMALLLALSDDYLHLIRIEKDPAR